MIQQYVDHVSGLGGYALLCVVFYYDTLVSVCLHQELILCKLMCRLSGSQATHCVFLHININIILIVHIVRYGIFFFFFFFFFWWGGVVWGVVLLLRL